MENPLQDVVGILVLQSREARTLPHSKCRPFSAGQWLSMSRRRLPAGLWTMERCPGKQCKLICHCIGAYADVRGRPQSACRCAGLTTTDTAAYGTRQDGKPAGGAETCSAKGDGWTHRVPGASQEATGGSSCQHFMLGAVPGDACLLLRENVTVSTNGRLGMRRTLQASPGPRHDEDGRSRSRSRPMERSRGPNAHEVRAVAGP
jgi:hypothetical protein